MLNVRYAMDAYHGTTQQRARRIFDQGLLPLPPSRRVWFAESRAYAMGRAKTQARRTKGVPVVLACGLDLHEIRRQLGGKGVVYKEGIIAIDGPVPVELLHSICLADLATVPSEIAAWASYLLALEPEESIRPSHPGVIRLSRWINAHIASEDKPKLLCSELIEKAKRWLPEYFRQAELGVRSLRAHRRVGLIEYEVDARHFEVDPREGQALEWLDHPRPDQRVRGLSLLAEIGDPDLFDWCAMFAEDEAVTVRIAALRTMLQCDDANPGVIEPLAASEDPRVRAAAISVLATHGGADAPRWIKRGLSDPEACVRVEAVRFLGQLDPRQHRSLLEFATHDPNRDIAARARKLLLAKRNRR